MNKNEVNDIQEPLCFLVIFSLALGLEVGNLDENLAAYGSTILSDPILFSESILETTGNILYFTVPIIIFITAFCKNNLTLKISYMLGSLVFVLLPSVINRLEFKSLYAVKIVTLIIIITLLMKYLKKTINFNVSDSSQE